MIRSTHINIFIFVGPLMLDAAFIKLLAVRLTILYYASILFYLFYLALCPDLLPQVLQEPCYYYVFLKNWE